MSSKVLDFSRNIALCFSCRSQARPHLLEDAALSLMPSERSAAHPVRNILPPICSIRTADTLQTVKHHGSRDA